MSPGQRRLIEGMVKFYGHDSGTESLIGYIAANVGMLDACRNLFDIHGKLEPALASWLRLQCAEFDVGERELLQAVSQVLSLLNADHSSDDSLTILGLTAGATQDDIKRAYRKLSLLHHPDLAKQNGNNDPERFIEINRAYHQLTQSGIQEKNQVRNNQAPYWNKTRKRGISSRRKRKLMYWGSGAVALLIVISIIGTLNVRRRAMLAGLTEDRGAFIPPQVEEEVNVSPSVRAELTSPSMQDDIQQKTVALELPQDSKSAPQPTSSAIVQSSQIPIRIPEDDADQASAPEPLSVSAVIDHPSQAPVMVAQDDTDQASSPGRQSEPRPEPQSVTAAVDHSSQPQNNITADEADQAHTSDEGAKESRESTPIAANKSFEPTEKTAIQATGEFSQAQLDRSIEESSDSVDQPSADVDASLELGIREESVGTSKEIAVVSPSAVREPEVIETPEPAVQAASADEAQPIGDADTPMRQQPDLQQRIDMFLHSYQAAYARGSIPEFISFFTPDAVENDKKFSDRLSVYQNLFDQTERSDLKITMLSWRQVDDMIEIDGRFKVALDYKTGKHLSGSGPISFTMVARNEDFMITGLSYHFEN